MKCPYCGHEMEQGLIQSNQELSWIPGSRRKLFGRAAFHEGAVVLSRLSFARGSAVVAFLCRDCGRIVIDFGDEASDLNAPEKG